MTFVGWWSMTALSDDCANSVVASPPSVAPIRYRWLMTFRSRMRFVVWNVVANVGVDHWLGVDHNPTATFDGLLKLVCKVTGLDVGGDGKLRMLEL
jgi:hypothetical protein